VPPLPPLVLGPLSVCSARIRVQGQVTGSTVTLFANGNLVGKAVATGPDQWIDLDSGSQLPPHARVTATQEDSGGASAPSPQPIVVQARPRHPGHVVYVSHAWVGGECILVSGATPGAEITLTGHGGSFTATADDGTATVHRKPLQPAEVMQAFQTACGVIGPRTASAPAEALPTGYATLRFQDPLSACQMEISLHGAADGGTVTIARASGATQAGCFPVSDAIVDLSSPLQENETITCQMELPRGTPVGPLTTDRVGPQPPEPAIRGHLCAGSTTVIVTGLVRGQRLAVLQDGQSLGYCSAPSATFAVPVPPLQVGSRITLEYGLCDETHTTTQAWTVEAAPATLDAPVMAPAVACAEVIQVSKVHPGASVQIFSEQLGAPIGQGYAEGTTVAITVAPLLVAGDRLSAVQTGCGHTSRPSNSVTVAATGTPSQPVIAVPLLEGQRTVTVTNVRTGARVDLYIAGLFAGSALATSASVSVPVQQGGFPLLIGQKVEAVERLCTTTTHSDVAVVTAVPPTIRFTATPTSSITRGEQTTLFWRIDNADRATIDQGIGTVAVDGSRPVQPQSTTTYTLTAWHRDVSRSAHVTINVAAPLPPPPPPPFQQVLLQPVAPGLGGGNEGWQGSAETLNRAGVLTAIENPHTDITLRLIKNGSGFADCNKPDAVIVLGPNARTQPADLDTLYGTQTPQLLSGVPFAIRACAGGNVIGPTGTPIAIVVNAYLTLT
jgi:hypothetical protein